MGSGGKRNKADTVVLKTKKAHAGSGGGGGSSKKEGWDSCPTSFVQVLEKSPFKKGTTVSLRVEGDKLGLYVGLQKIGEIASKRAEKIISCIRAGLLYEGVLVEKDDRYHAEFRIKQ